MGTYSDASSFIEGQLMLAATQEDEEELARLLNTMTNRELEHIDDALTMISREITEIYRQRRIAADASPAKGS